MDWLPEADYMWGLNMCGEKLQSYMKAAKCRISWRALSEGWYKYEEPNGLLLLDDFERKPNIVAGFALFNIPGAMFDKTTTNVHGGMILCTMGILGVCLVNRASCWLQQALFKKRKKGKNENALKSQRRQQC